MPEYETRTTSMTIVPKGEPLFSEQATQVTTVDEAGGVRAERQAAPETRGGTLDARQRHQRRGRKVLDC